MSDTDAIDPELTSDFEVGQDNVQVLGLDVHNPVFFVSSVIIVAFVILTLIFGEASSTFFNWLRPALTDTFDWPLLMAANVFVLFGLALIVTPLGNIRLGGVDARPDYSYLGWFAMLFAAGMGIGLMFFGVSEPLSHYASSFGGAVVENGVRTDWGAACRRAERSGGCKAQCNGCDDLPLGSAP
ncbi:MAG: BCCT family transporter, partial [Parvibaculum sp.]